MKKSQLFVALFFAISAANLTASNSQNSASNVLPLTVAQKKQARALKAAEISAEQDNRYAVGIKGKKKDTQRELNVQK